MLIYNPAFDFHHGIFRMLQILSAAPGERFEVMKIRLLDFLLLFPEQLDQIRIPTELRGKRGLLAQEESPYRTVENPHRLFIELAPFQHQALYTLAARELIDPQQLKDDYVVRTSVALPAGLEAALAHRNGTTPHLVDIVSRDLARLPLFGANGLKARAKFLNTRHDTA